MKNNNFERVFITFLGLLSFSLFNNCSKDAIEAENNGIKPFTRFTSVDIPALKDATQVKYGETPWSIEQFRENYLARYEFRWEMNDDYVYIVEYVLENKYSAQEYLLEMHQYYTNPFIEELKDQPAVVGDISYIKGREFIRDNIIIKINSSGGFDSVVTSIAKQVDNKILKSPTFPSADLVKPLIKKFEITQNSVKEKSETKLIIEIADPHNKNFVFNWVFNPNSGYGGIRKDDLGNYYYTADVIDVAEIQLTLIVTNEYGYCSDSTINIYIAVSYTHLTLPTKRIV